MKKLVYLSMALVFLVALFPASASAHTEEDPMVVDLLAGQTKDIGDVLVWNNTETLYVKFVSEGDCFLEIHLQVDEDMFSPDILTKKGNPIPGQFEKSYSNGCFSEHTFTYNLADEGFTAGDNLLIAAHAALGREEAMTFVSNAGDTIYGPIYSDIQPTEWGLAGSAVRAYNWLGYTRDLNDPDQIPECTTNPISSLDWSWGFGLNPTNSPDIPGVHWISTAPNTEQWPVDSWRKVVESFEVPGYPIEGVLEVNADNYYVASNGETIGSDDNIFNGPETYTFYPVEGLNSLEFVTENWAQGSAANYCDQLRNPNGVTYKGTVSYYADGETAWGCGEDNCTDFDGKNWATYFMYTVQCTNVPNMVNGGFEEPVVNTSQGWDIFTSDQVGWTVAWAGEFSGAPTDSYLELHRGVNNWSPYSGQYAELDTDWQGPGSAGGEQASVRISQDIATCAGFDYTLQYAWSPRPNHGDNVLKVYVDGVEVASHTATGGSDTVWTESTVTFTASGSTTTIEFVEAGTPDSLGMFLDEVSVTLCDGSCP